ncbi:MAG: hypothetical protein PWP72_1291 [Thermoanaerobacter sp.]|jgi:hypothetical protein|nr:hypothetical protein [Thermoanaerobacter sp.]
MGIYRVLYFLRDCPVQWHLKISDDIALIPLGELGRLHEAEFISEFCNKNNFPDIDVMAFKDHPMCRTPVVGLLIDNIKAQSLEEVENVIETKKQNIIAIISYYWKQVAIPFGVLVFNMNDGRMAWRLIENNLRRIINIPFDNPSVMFKVILDNMTDNHALRHWFFMFFEGIREQNFDYKWFKYMSLLEVISKYLHRRGLAPKDTKQGIRKLYSLINLATPQKRGAYDGIDVAYKHRHCSAHFGGCIPGQNHDCESWCQDWLPDIESLLEHIESDIWFILRHAKAFLK